jgi:predicted DCC family thiol-disulfide oxidoreductase YuxK
MAQPAPLLVVYDAESARSRRWVDWIRRRDTAGLIVTFPFQNPELVRIAPELAGRPLHLVHHGLDTRTRRIWTGERLLPHVWARLPRWRWVIFLTWIPGITSLLSKLTSK